MAAALVCSAVFSGCGPLGPPLAIRPAGDQGTIMYAGTNDAGVYVATGEFREERLRRLITALQPESPGPSGIDLYGGDVRGERGPDELVADGTYLLLGSVAGDRQVSMVTPDGRRRPATASSTSVLPGYTVFYDTGAWQDDWDQVRLAPLTVVTNDGRRAAVRDESWTG